MQLRTVQWNIGGAHIRTFDADPSQAGSYVNEDLSYIIEKLVAYKPDIITLQETHADDSGSQAKIISEALGLLYYINDPYDKSHIDTSQKLCQSIISRFPIKDHSFSLFLNPHFRKVMEDGSEWISHDKGVSTIVLDVEGTELVVQTLHLIPLRKFDIDVLGEEGKKVTESIEALMEKKRSKYLLQGDFNHHNIRALLPSIFTNEINEVGGDTPTTPKGRIYDHVFFRGFKQGGHPLIDSKVLTDHYPVISEFEYL